MADAARSGRVFSADDSVALLTRPQPGAAVHASGQGLFALMALRLAGPEARAGLADPADLAYVRIVGGELRIGSLTRHADLFRSALACEHLAILRDADRVFACRGVRCSETVGGILCQADPADDLAAVFAALRAAMLIRGRGGTRAVPAREFRLGPYETVVEPGELLTEIRIPVRPCGSAYEAVTRLDGGCPVTGAAAVICLDGDTVAGAGLGLTPASARQRGPAQAEELLIGGQATQLNLERAGEIASGQCECSADSRRPAGSGQCVAGQLTTRALRRALLRAQA
jgi:aerobic carbon-monoxide dehydrogenase medium subunit